MAFKLDKYLGKGSDTVKVSAGSLGDSGNVVHGISAQILVKIKGVTKKIIQLEQRIYGD